MTCKFKKGDKVVLSEIYKNLVEWLEPDVVYTVSNTEYFENTGNTIVYFDNGNRGTYDYKITLHSDLNLKDQINFAKSLIGKTITSRSTPNLTGKVSGFDIFHDLSELVNINTKNSAKVGSIFDNQGVLIVLSGVWADGIDMEYWISNSSSDNCKIKNTITINGYVSVDKGDYVEFGCARISKVSLRYAQQFMENYEVYNSESNKNLTSIKIGNGEFTLEDINTLLS